MKPVRLAVIGAGVIGSRHIELISASSCCQLVAICDTDPAREALANELAVPFYTDYEWMLDTVAPAGTIVATPTEHHATVGLACVARSVVPLIEKPITARLDAGRRLLEVADGNAVPVLVGHHRRFNPYIRRARTIVQNGDLGRLVGVTAMWSVLKPADYFEVAWRTQPGGGPVLINLIHEIDSLRYICGEIRSVYAATSSAIRGFEVEDSVSITLEFENGALGSLLASDAVPSPWSYELTTRENPAFFHADENCYVFLGSNGSLAFPRMELWQYANEREAGWQSPLLKSQLSLGRTDPLTAQLSHFCRVIRGEETPVCSGAEALRTLAATLAVLDSARQKSPVHLASRP